ncbi:MAG: hypothetical protein PHS73_02505 [Candidatus Peribacteraceae bacterium]|nr:hypothetical protein [Candidatus Peribacteraceae bacterium]
MTMTTLQTRPPQAFSRLVIDCSGKADFAVNGLLEWVKACPERSAVHIILPSARRHAEARTCRRTLVGLGCTVTTRLPLSPQKV